MTISHCRSKGLSLGVAFLCAIYGCSKNASVSETEIIVRVPSDPFWSQSLKELNKAMTEIHEGPASRTLRFEFRPSKGLMEVVASPVYVSRGSVTFRSKDGLIRLLPGNKVVLSSENKGGMETRDVAGSTPAIVFACIQDLQTPDKGVFAFQKINVVGSDVQNATQVLELNTNATAWVASVRVELSEDFQGALTNWMVRTGK
jgi:hypothetical protein